ncbi:MAG: 50S ribosomal protein L29 [bacterium]|nr:50S ribosomal protein L29 [bacterium]
MAISKKKTNFKTKEKKELTKELVEKEKQLLEAKIAFTQQKVKDVHTSRKIRKEIAQIKTFLREKELGVT